MGAFGENTMAFEQWIQFVLVPRLRGIVRDRGEFPSASQLAVHAVRALDGDTDAERLHELLDALDRLVELSALLTKAAAATTNATSRARIEHAAQSVARGDRAAKPDRHEEAMKKYQEEHRRSFGPCGPSRSPSSWCSAPGGHVDGSEYLV
jgi:hypothetical protein